MNIQHFSPKEYQATIQRAHSQYGDVEVIRKQYLFLRYILDEDSSIGYQSLISVVLFHHR